LAASQAADSFPCQHLGELAARLARRLPCPGEFAATSQHNKGFSRLQIVSRSLRSICVDSRYFHQGSIQQLVIEDAPCLERLLYLGGTQMNITYLHQGWLFWGNSF
jgi:hypothetical protein